jgi:NhaP-type Na+/H+ and K+/H+ antiporter
LLGLEEAKLFVAAIFLVLVISIVVAGAVTAHLTKH